MLSIFGGRDEGLNELMAAVRAYFITHASRYGLHPELQVNYVLNEGGFVNHSFRITDGVRSFHLKLATSEHSHAELLRWQRVGAQLERYRAPGIISWVDVGAAGGLLFNSAPGVIPYLDDAVLHEVLAVTRALNADCELADILRDDAQRTTRDVYFASYHERFVEDLKYIRGARPPFVAGQLIDWLMDEADRLAKIVVRSAAFDQPADQPTHGDLWLNNILWQNSEHWHIVDWDGIALGDPMTDLAMLTGPAANDLTPLKMYDQVAAQLSSVERERLRILGRASLLDWIIDPLSDWIDADVVPAHAQEMRALKERVHTGALALYRELY
ncbi:MAG TPA: aminoglycoside phosphotransferase family protein [Longimicrobiales bacterium]